MQSNLAHSPIFTQMGQMAGRNKNFPDLSQTNFQVQKQVYVPCLFCKWKTVSKALFPQKTYACNVLHSEVSTNCPRSTFFN